ncbi:tRNA (uridine-5-oxyacetic acid methyl ester) 34 synthase [Bathymodiolus heckerae thiotrophic gill symbiont]|uniref:carboxy-S-adenosyl-L-methionine synthase CmoA n=1 Tax=Bathymodiolus heckerae thiotrophic gill symbiont TaxID=1052212 RepID=UPI0010B7890F|nr:carboxy-S-adenosyl-L-methionine synthase CmoA [Bathymodiolus heckerae thiotrophic gill symbiont]CAC9441020.1 Carboxy-S-adenosyl-L-methionine synthase [uncultured Gammaproteobacteria bacterium]SMN13256.1 tRNA (uridine-5-oxyacetic acid methyl ester) 34 synthase [Bathymodiolus heckerae thiotrophic gill symbiont]SMN14652.1 tRNA (uridine-5-oxyacetic acid methyl ester) 34 synthase [uncultured Candidatus Thioglobus sp.]
MRDKLFANKKDLVDFTFDENVANVFDDMVKRSVPGYQSMIEMIGLMVKTYGQNHTNYYDLGTSTGATALAFGFNNPHKNNCIIAVDNSINMTQKCQENLTNRVGNFKVICADIEDMVIDNASIVVLNLTLQFIAPEQRQALITKIYQGLNKGGALIVSEKIHFEDEKKQNEITKLHLDFKRANGYSELEIANKRQAIDNILITDSKKTHFERFKTAGFSQNSCYFQCLNFASFLVIK